MEGFHNKIGVMAGTYVDTKMGVDFLRTKGHEALGLPLSVNPKEQSRLQILSKTELYKMVVDKINQAKAKKIQAIFVYCNSLSAAVNMDKISKEENIRIITPFHFYEDIGDTYSSLFIMGANAQSCERVEQVLEASNPSIRLWSLSILALVEAIEEGIDPETIFKNHGLDKILDFVKCNNIEAILLACTHFPYLEETIKRNTDTLIINPAEGMYAKLIKLLFG